MAFFADPEKIKRFAELLEKEQLAELIKRGYFKGNENAAKVSIIPGKKYVKVDVGKSGKYMVDPEGNIWGIKAYGVIHRGHQYGNLDTINDWYWGGYVGVKKNG